MESQVEESHLLHDTYIFMTFLSTILRITNNIKVLRKNRLGKWKREINRIKKKKKHFAYSRPFKLIKNKNSQNKIPFPQYDPKKNSNPPYRQNTPTSSTNRSSSPNKTNFFFSSPNSNSPFHASNLISLINPTQTFLSFSKKNSFSNTIRRNETLGLSRARGPPRISNARNGRTKGRWW